MDPVPLDPSLVSRFKDKTMAIVGYETDQVVSSYIVLNDYEYILENPHERSDCTFLILLFLFVGYENK